MSTAIGSAVSQTARNLRIKTNANGDPTFCVQLDMGSWVSDREVTVTDSTIDIADLIRRIAEFKTSVTNVEWTEGEICYAEGGRKYLVGSWETIGTPYDDDDITISFDDGDGGEQIKAEDLEGLTVTVVEEDDEDGGPVAQVEYQN